MFAATAVTYGSGDGVLPPVLPNPSACNLDLPIHDNSCNTNHEFKIDVGAAPGTMLGTDVYLKEVRLIIEHEWVADLDLVLISPSGKMVELTSDNGSGNDNYGNPLDCSEYTSFISSQVVNACSTISIEEGSAPFIGQYLPEQPFARFNDGSDPHGLWTLQACDDGQQHYGTLEFLELVFEATDCLRPTGVVAGTVDSNSVSLNWNIGSNCGSTLVEYGPPGFTPGNGGNPGMAGSVVLTGCPPFLLTGLNPSSDYDIYIREHCGNGNYSDNSCITSISTTCSPPPATLVENFNGQTSCSTICGIPCEITGIWSNSLVDDFDWIVNHDSVATSETGPQDDFPGGGNYIYIESNGSLCRNGREAVLVSNCIQAVANADSCDMSFDYIMYGVHINSLQLDVSADGGQTWQNLWIAQGNKGDQWLKQFIDLDDFHNQTVQFRFLAKGGNGVRADIALDNIVFYGSQDLGPPPYLYFQDADGDGYGGKNIYFSTCQPGYFPGFVPDNTDCDDTEAAINPGAVEVPCDGFDLNCNGMVDEYYLPPPATRDSTVCSGLEGAVYAEANLFEEIYWYDSPSGGNPLGSGSYFTPDNFPVNPTTDSIVLTFYAEAVKITFDTCYSTSRSPASIVILPQPDLSSADNPLICAGYPFDLTTIDVVDNNGVNGTITYHHSFPTSQANEIDPVVRPVQDSVFYIASTPDGGCTDVASVNFTIKPTPDAQIIGDDAICYNTSDVISVADTGSGIPPLEFEWNTGDTGEQITINSHAIKGESDVYIAYITGANGCRSSDTLAVQTVTSVDTVETVVGSVSVCEGSDGSITLSPVDGVPPYNYYWNGGSALNEPGNLTINNLEQGGYSFTITDSSPQGCEFEIPIITVDGPGAIVTSSEVSPVSCSNGSDGCIEINVIGDDPSILWSTGDTTEQICGLSSGSYGVTITDGNCTNILNFFVPQPSKIILNPTVDHVTCHGASNGSIYLNAFGGTPFYQFNWGHGPTSQSLNNLVAGNYSVTITDTKGCSQEVPNITITQPDPISYELQSLEEPSCNGFADGQISILPTGGTMPYDVDWSNAGMGTTITNLMAGTYQVSIGDANGCEFVDQLSLSEPTPVEITVDELQAPVCNGIDNGHIYTTVQGGLGGYTFLWNNGSQTPDLDNLPPGDYLLSVTDNNGCLTVSDTLNLEENETLEIAVDAVDPSCIGVDNGTIDIEVLGGGAAPFTCIWSTDDTGCSLSDLSAGDYTVTIIDSDGCRFDSTITIVTEQVLNVQQTTFPPSCFNMDNGQIFLNMNGGVEPYDIQWSDGRSDNPLTELAAGNYAATITDDSGCKFFTGLMPLSEPDSLEIKVINVENVICAGGTDGLIEINTTGGTGDHLITWSNGSDEKLLVGLEPGNYQVTLSDDNNCVTVSPVIEITAPDPLQAAPNLTVTGCNGGIIDSVCIEVLGGVTPYQYSWNNGAGTACLINAPTGDYSLTVSDAVGCTVEVMSVKVPEDIEIITLSQVGASDTICYNSQTGSLQVEVGGGLGPYQYNWSNGVVGITGDTLLTNSGLSPGDYQITITDNVGCTVSMSNLTVEGSEPILLNASGSQIQHVNCKSGADGQIDLIVTGGLPGYSYSWKDVLADTLLADTEDIGGLPAGIYAVTVTDEMSCTAHIQATILEPEQHLGIDSIRIIDESCFEYGDGAITIYPAGGTPQYQFNWNNGWDTQNLNGLSPGVYQLTITDENSCAYQSAAFIVNGPDEPVSLEEFSVQHVTCFGGADGIVDVDFTGGTMPYFYDWTISNTEDLINYPAGMYELAFSDANGCLFDTSFVLEEPAEILVNIDMEPVTEDPPNGTLTAMATGGLAPYTYSWSTGDLTPAISGLSAGWYEVIVTDANFCQQSVWVEVQDLVSVSQDAVLGSYSLSPNPTSDMAALHLQLSSPSDLRLNVYNQMGQVVYAQQAKGFHNGDLPIDLSGHSPGLYVVELNIEGARPVAFKLSLTR